MQDEVIIKTNDMKKLFSMLNTSQQRRVTIKALNQVGKDAEKAAKMKVKATYNLKGRWNEYGYKRKRATNYKLSVEFKGDFKRLLVTRLKGTRQIRAGLRFTVRKKAVVMPKGFIAKYKRIPLARVGRTRLPVKRVDVLSFGKMISTKEQVLIYNKIVARRGQLYLDRAIKETIFKLAGG